MYISLPQNKMLEIKNVLEFKKEVDVESLILLTYRTILRRKEMNERSITLRGF